MDTYRKYFYVVLIMLFAIVIFMVDCLSYLSSRRHLPTNKINVMANTTSCVTGRPCTYSDVVDFRVIVITFNRAISLLKLLRSLNTLILDGDRAAVEIWIDRHRKNGIDQRTIDVASTFSWTGGPTRIHVQVRTVCTWHCSNHSLNGNSDSVNGDLKFRWQIVKSPTQK